MFTLCTSIVRFLVRALGDRPGQSRTEAARRLYGNRAISVQLPCSLHTEIVRSPCSFRAEAARRWCGDHAAAVPFFGPNVHLKSCIFCTISAWPPRGARAGIVQCHLRHVYGIRAYDCSNLYNFSLNKIVEAVAPVNPYENAASCFRTEATRKGGYGLRRPIADPS